MDYAPGHVGDDNYVTTQSTIIPNANKNITTANKSGKTNTATITKEPKRQPFSWADDNPLDGWDDRSFLEGFYEVDSTTKDWEREERMSQVEKALQDIRSRRTGDMLRRTKDIFQPVNYSAQNATTPRAEFHAAPSWFSPLEESNDDVVNAGREYAANIVDNKFNQGWRYALGKENVYDYSSPVYNSRYKDVLIDSVTDNAKADFVAGLGAGAKFLYDVKSNADDMDSKIDVEPIHLLPQKKKAKGKQAVIDYILGTVKTIGEGGISDMANNYQELRENNARAKQSQRQYEYLNNSEFKYLVDDEKAREKFVNTLKTEVQNLQNTERLGFLPSEINETYKQEAINYLMRIIFLNQNYDKYSTERDLKLQSLLGEK